MDLDGIDVDNLSQDEILELYNDILDNNDSIELAYMAPYYSNGYYCECVNGTYHLVWCWLGYESSGGYKYSTYNNSCK